MRRYWDERAKLNAPWYVDTSLEFAAPDMDRFFETGRRVVTEALDPVGGPVGTSLAVEIGCGLGRVCLALAERCDRVVGIDISPEMLRRAVPHPRVSYVVGDGASLGMLADGIADLVLTFTVFQHIPSPSVIEGYIAEAARILRPGGIFVFQWNNIPGSLGWSVRRAVLSSLQRVGLGDPHGRNDAAFLGSRVPMRRIERAVASAGLELEGSRGVGTLFAWAWARRA